MSVDLEEAEQHAFNLETGHSAWRHFGQTIRDLVAEVKRLQGFTEGERVRRALKERDEARRQLAWTEEQWAVTKDAHANAIEGLTVSLNKAMKSTLVRIRWDSNIAALHVAKMMANECLQKLGYAPPDEAEVWDIHAQGTKERQERYNVVAPYEKECDELRAKLARKDALIAEWKDEETYWRKKDEELRAKLAEAEADITDLKKNYAGMRDTQRMLVIERDEAQAKLAEAERENENLLSTVGQMTKSKKGLEAKLAEADATIQQACQQLDAKDEQLSDLRRQLAFARDAIQVVVDREWPNGALLEFARSALVKIGGST